MTAPPQLRALLPVLEGLTGDDADALLTLAQGHLRAHALLLERGRPDLVDPAFVYDVWDDADVQAWQIGDGWRLHGRCLRPSDGADAVVLPADDAGTTRWFLVTAPVLRWEDRVATVHGQVESLYAI